MGVFGNPIIAREFTNLLRSRRAIHLFVAVAAASSALVLMRWPSDAIVDLSGNQSRQVFRVFGYGMLATVLLLTPVFPATSIVREKNQGTLALLFNSPLGPVSIFVGKLIGALGFLAVLLMMSVPAAAALTAMGGVSPLREIGGLYALLALAALQNTAISLWISSRATTSDGALRWSFAAVLAVSVVAIGPHQFLQGRGTESLLSTGAEYLRCVSPIPAAMELMAHSDVASQGFESRVRAAPGYPLAALAITLAAAIATTTRLNYRIFDRARSQGVMTHERSRGEQWARRLFFLVDPQRRTRGIAPLVNPVLVKEFRCRRFGRFHWLMRLMAASAVVSLVLTLASTTATMERGVETIGGIMVALQVALIVLLTPTLAATLISGEVESGGWTLLQMTPMSAARILSGKLMSVLWTLLLIIVSTLPGYLVIVWISPESWLKVRVVLICLAWTAAFALLASATVSAFCRRAATSTTVAYVLLLSVYAGTMLIWLGRDAPFGHAMVENALRINTMAAALSVMGTPGFVTYRLIPDAWWITGGACVGFAVVLVLRARTLTRPQ
ncbi:MAG: ABC transporter [Planctomycetes bacterium]|nr:ABC transporter [Planctomycetota bacterium]